MDIFEVIETRASVRKFLPVDIPEEHLMKIVDAGRKAPSGKNIQPLYYIVIKDKGTLEKLSKVQGCIAEATAAIAIVADPEMSTFWIEDASAAAENMLLALTALGYSSVWIEGTLLANEQLAKETLGVPTGLRLIIILPIGKPADEPQQKPKKSLEELVHRDKW